MSPPCKQEHLFSLCILLQMFRGGSSGQCVGVAQYPIGLSRSFLHHCCLGGLGVCCSVIRACCQAIFAILIHTLSFFFFNDTFLPGFDIQRKPRSLGVEHLPGRGRPCVLSLALQKTASVFLGGEGNEEVPAG